MVVVATRSSAILGVLVTILKSAQETASVYRNLYRCLSTEQNPC